MSKYTPWFDGEIKPARPGVYQQRSGLEKTIGYQRWDGVAWSTWHETANSAAKDLYRAAHFYQNDPWRGLVKPTRGQS